MAGTIWRGNKQKRDGPNFNPSKSDIKKKTFRAKERESESAQQKREEFLEAIKTIPPDKLVFLDEAGFNLAMTRLYARSHSAERCFSIRPANRGGNISLVGSIRLSGLVAMYPYDGAIDGYRFLDYLANQLLKSLNPGDVLVMDNFRVHHIEPVREMLLKAEIRLLFLPPYSPELNPIEEAWSKVKAIFRGFEAKTISSFVDALKETYDAITVENIKGWFQHAGYV